MGSLKTMKISFKDSGVEAIINEKDYDSSIHNIMIMKPHFIVHEKVDTVGVVVVNTIDSPQKVVGWLMETDETIEMDCKSKIPLGHKIALQPINSGDKIMKYGNDIGKAISDIEQGGYVHVHNVKTKRW